MPATGLKMLLLLVLLFRFLLTAFSPEACPPSGCFQTFCWDLSLIDGHTFHAVCHAEGEGEGEVRENHLDLNLCVGIEGRKLQWEDGGFFAGIAELTFITNADQFRDDRPIVLTGYCPSGRDRGPSFNCKLDLSEKIWIDRGQLGCFDHRAEAHDPYDIRRDMPGPRDEAEDK